jgi:hypothetical protein
MGRLTKADGEAALRSLSPVIVQALKIVEQIGSAGEIAGPFPEGFKVLS